MTIQNSKLPVLKKLFILSLFLSILSFNSCKEKEEKELQTVQETHNQVSKDSLFFKISLAQWSLNKPIFNGDLNPMDFAQKAHELGFEAIEYVSTFYADSIKQAQNPETGMRRILDTLKSRSERYGVQNLLIMVDEEGDLAQTDSVKRKQAIENHKKWIDAANFLGCHSIRVNLFGSNIPEDWKQASVKSLKELADYGQKKGINILVENHGYLSSNADLLAEVIQKVNSEYCGTLPDFGNFCLKREGNQQWEGKCLEEYPKYKGVEKLMDHAKAVSAKSYSFNQEGEEELIDYKRMLRIIKDHGYTGYIGVEFDGEDIPAEKGILATRDLLIKAAKQL